MPGVGRAAVAPRGHHRGNKAPWEPGLEGGEGWRRRRRGRSLWSEISAVGLDRCPGLPAKKTKINKRQVLNGTDYDIKKGCH